MTGSVKSNIKCLNCGKYWAQKHPMVGILPCIKCQVRQKKYKVQETVEITTNETKMQRKEYRRDILQRYERGHANLDYIKEHGKQGFSHEEIQKARSSETTYYVDREARLRT